MARHGTARPPGPRIGLVLAGGAARGAYEVGVLDHIVEHVARDLGHDVPLDILSGTSVGAANVCALAAWADEPKARVGRLVAEWTGLRINDVVRPTTSSVMDTLRNLICAGYPDSQGGIGEDLKFIGQWVAVRIDAVF